MLKKDYGKMECMKSYNRYIINDGSLFNGTIEQFCDCFFNTRNEIDIVNWCCENEYKLEIVHEYDMKRKVTQIEKNQLLAEGDYLTMAIMFMENYPDIHLKMVQKFDELSNSKGCDWYIGNDLMENTVYNLFQSVDVINERDVE